MRKQNDGSAGNCLVAKYIGSDFDHVMNVSENMEAVKHVNGMDAQIKEVLPHVDNIKRVGDGITEVIDVSKHMDLVGDVHNHMDSVQVNAHNINTITAIGRDLRKIEEVAINLDIIKECIALEPKLDEVIKNEDNIELVSTNMDSVVNVSTNMREIYTVGAMKKNIDAIGSISDEVATVGRSIYNIDKVSGGLKKINKVANGFDHITKISPFIDDVAATGTNIQDVITVSQNLDHILNLSSDIYKVNDGKYAQILRDQGYNIIGASISNPLLTDASEMFVHDGKVYSYVGTFPHQVAFITFQPNYYQEHLVNDLMKQNVLIDVKKLDDALEQKVIADVVKRDAALKKEVIKRDKEVKEEVLTDVFGSKPVDLVDGLVIKSVKNQYPKLLAFDLAYELVNNSIDYTVKSFKQSVDLDCVITLSDDTVIVAKKVEAATRDFAQTQLEMVVTGSTQQLLLNDLLRNLVTVKNYGAVGDGKADDSDAALKMLADVGFIRFHGLNRITKTIVINDIGNAEVYGDGMHSETTKMLIDGDFEDIFAHGGAAWSGNGFTLRDLNIKKINFTGDPTKKQHVYTPKAPNGWKDFHNIQVMDVGGTFYRTHGDGLDTYSQRIHVDNLLLWRCGAFSCITEDDTVIKHRPVCTIANLNNIDYKDGRGGFKYIYDLRGWRYIQSNATWETGMMKDKASHLVATIGMRTNAACRLGSLWYEGGNDSPKNMIHFDVNPPSTVDGGSGSMIYMQSLDSTRQGLLFKFEKGTSYQVELNDLGSIYTWYHQPKDLCDWGSPITVNKNHVTINRFFWRSEKNKSTLPMPLPSDLYGTLTIKNIGTNAFEYVPMTSFDLSPVLFDWVADGTKTPDQVESMYMNIALDDASITTKGYARHLESLAYNIARNTGGVPKIKFNLTSGLAREYGGSWITISIDYVNKYSGTGYTAPNVITDANSQTDRFNAINNINQNGSAYSQAVFWCQISKAAELISTGLSGNEECNFYIRSIKATLGLHPSMNKTNQ